MVLSQDSSFESCSSKSLKTYISFSKQIQISGKTYFQDESGHANNALNTNVAAPINGACQNCATFGTTGKAEIPAQTSLLPQKYWTVEFNFKGTKPTKTETMVQLFASPSITFTVDTNGFLNVLISSLSMKLSTNYMDDIWHHIKLSKNGDIFTATVDGQTSVSTSASVFFSSSNIIIGSDGSSSFSGSIDEFKIWSCSNPAEPNYPTGCPSCSSNSNCNSRGTCVAENYCLCNKGYGGSSCQLDINVDNCTADSIKAYYSFQKNDIYQLSSKNFLIDLSANGNDAELVTSNSIFSTSGACKEGLLTNGNDYLKVPFTSDFSPNGYFTVQFWFKIPSAVTDEKVLLQMLDSPVIQFSAIASNKISVKLTETGKSSVELAKGFVRNYHDNNWHHMLFQKQLNQFTVTVDGIESSFSNINLPVNTDQQSTGIIIGADKNGRNASSSFIDELKVWSCANVTEPDGLTEACPNCTLKNGCSGNGVCAGDYCVCNPGYIGTTCSSFTCRGKSPSDPLVCSGKGTCSGPEKCVCQNGYSGQNCQFQSTTSCKPDYYLPPRCNVLLTSFKFTSNLASLQANSTIGSITSCSSLFDAQSLRAIGSAQCESNNGIITVTLGRDATVKPSDRLLTNIYADTTPTTYQNITVLAADSPTPPTAVLSGPSVIGQCDDLTLRGDSSNSADRRQLTYEWSVIATTGSASKFSGIVSATKTSILTISSTNIDAGTYQFTLKVTNFLNIQSSAVFVVRKESNPSLVLTSSPVTSVLYRSMDVVLSTKANFASCYPADTTRVILWTQTSGVAVTGFSSLKRTEHTLTIPAYSIPSAGVYKFQISVTPNAFPNQVITSEFSITISSLPVVASIQGGEKQVSKLTTFSLTSVSVDPDRTNETETFNWVCTTADGNCAGIPSAQTSQIFLTLSVPGTYYFTLNYQKGTRTSTASTTVKSIDSIKPLPNVVIEGGSKKTVAAANDNSIKAIATLNLGDTFNYLWTQTFGPTLNLDDSTTILTSKTSVELVFAASKLTAGSIYGFTVEATLSTDSTLKSSANVTVEVSTPPQIGTIVSTPQSGAEFSTAFKFDCQGFGGSSLQYAFYTRDVDQLNVLREFQTSPILENVHLKSGTNNIVVVRCVARDLSGSTSFVESTISVASQLTSNVETNLPIIVEQQSVIDKRIQSGDSVGAYISILSLTKALNYLTTKTDCKCPNDCRAVDKTVLGTCTLKPNTFSTYYCKCNAGRAGEDCRYSTENYKTVSSFRSRLASYTIPLLQDTNLNQQKIEKLTDIIYALTRKSQELGSSNKVQLVDAMKSLTKQGVQFKVSTQSVENFVYSFDEIINDNIIESNGTTLDVSESLKELFSLYTAYVGQTKSILTCGFSVSTQKVLRKSLTNKKLQSETTVVTLPSSGFLSQFGAEEEVSLSLSKVVGNPYRVTDSSTLSSELVDFSVFDKNKNKIQVSNLPNPIKLQIRSTVDIEKVKSRIQNLQCRYYKEANQTWSTEGCIVSNYTSTMVECECTHLTTFASFIEQIVVADFFTANFTVIVTVFITVILYLVSLIGIIAYGLVQDKYFPKEEDENEPGIFRYLVEELKKSHIYLSLFAKLKYNNFSRDQRLSVIFITIIGLFSGTGAIYSTTSFAQLNYGAAAFIAILFALPFTAFFTFLFNLVAPYPNLMSAKQQNALNVVDPNNLGRNTDFEMDEYQGQELDQQNEAKEEKIVKKENAREDDDTEVDAEVKPARTQAPKKDPISVNVDDSKEICGAIYTAFLDWGDLSFETYADTVSDPLKFVTIGGLYLFYTLVHALILITYILIFTLVLKTASLGLGVYVSFSICLYVGTILFAYLNIKVRSFKNEVFEDWFSFSNPWNIINAVVSAVLLILFVSIGIALILFGSVLPVIVPGSPNVVELATGFGIGCLVMSLILIVWIVCIFVKPTLIPDIRPVLFSFDFQKDAELLKTNSQRFLLPWWFSIPIYILLFATAVVACGFLIGFGFTYTSIVNEGQAFNWLYASLIAILLEVFLTKPFIVMVNFIGYHSIEALCYLLFFIPEDLRQESPSKSKSKPNTNAESNKNVGKTHEATFGKEFEIEEMGFLPDMSDEEEEEGENAPKDESGEEGDGKPTYPEDQDELPPPPEEDDNLPPPPPVTPPPPPNDEEGKVDEVDFE